MKRFFEIILTIILLLIALPVQMISIITAAVILFDNPVIRQMRKISLESKPVRIFKVRTIRRGMGFDNAVRKSSGIFENYEYEKYVPHFCRWLRKSGIDEIPQLINVVKGEMSLVGPRPFTEKDLLILKKNNPEIYLKRSEITSKPGITGYWQVYGDRSLGAENLINCDLFYERNKSFILDLRIIAKTLYVLLTAAHSDAILTVKNKVKSVRKNKTRLKTFGKTDIKESLFAVGGRSGENN